MTFTEDNLSNEIQVGVWSFYTDLAKNNFMLTNSGSGLGDDAFWGQNELCRQGKLKSIIFTTLDLVEDWSTLDAVLVFDYPKPVSRRCAISSSLVDKILRFQIPSFLILHECSVVKPNNWITSSHLHWTKIFTWNDDYAYRDPYVKLNMPARKIPENWFKYEIPHGFSTLVASNKKSFRSKEAYSDRLECINWFEKHQPEDLDLYGYGWDQYRLPDANRIFEKINKFSPLMRAIGPRYNVWKGELKSKRDIAGRYKFQFAYENAKDIPGYILEKIIDTFLLGSVPIYLGASNTSNYIPSDCFIDLNEFSNYKDLHIYLSSMSDQEYLGYLERIKKFIDGPDFHPFSVDCYVDTIISTITNELSE